METDVSHRIHNRREFIRTTLPLCCLSCVLGPATLAASADGSQVLDTQEHKFKTDTHWSYERVFRFAFASCLIPHLKNLADQVGHDQLVEMLKKSSFAQGEESGKAMAKRLGKNDLKTFGASLQSDLERSDFWKSVLSYDNLKVGDTVVSVQFTECLWAKTFRDADAAELGYAAFCHQDLGTYHAYNPKIAFTRPRTLMRGGDCCEFRLTQET